MKIKHWMILVITMVVCFAGCSSTLSGTDNSGRVNHIVLCWIKESGNIAHRERIIEASESFRKIPNVLEVRVGQVILSDRKMVDDSFDVGISISFSNTEDMNAYLNHPLHIKALNEVLRPLAKKVVVYDFVE